MGKISEKRIKELIQELKNVTSLKDSNKKSPRYWYNQKQNVVSSNVPTELIKEFLDEYNRVKKNTSPVEQVDTDDRANIEIERDEEGNIEYYKFEIFRKDKSPITGRFTREEMSLVYRLYSYYGASLTQRIVSRNFPEYSLVDFKRILRCFNITKASAPFAPHEIEENTEDELYEIQSRIKENNILRRIEKDEVDEYKKLVNKLAKENLTLKRNVGDFHFVEDVEIKPVRIKDKYPTDKSLMLHLSDFHVGAATESGSLYDNEWNEEELERRLDRVIDLVGSFGNLNTIVINMLGDYLDGMDGMTARRDHVMPQNMDNREQFNVFIRQMLGFIGQLGYYTNKIIIYAVPEGNHGGFADYMAIRALEYAVGKKFPDVEFTVFEKYYGYYEFNGHTYVINHGKDSKFMKRPMPLNINDSANVLLRDWLDAEHIYTENVHFIKGDLHSNNLNSCRKFDYRNVLSLFGNSDYSMMNYPTNNYGVSYDLFIDNIRTIGTFENF